ncbi:MAG: asparagine synthase-related protein [Syntrophobacteraceae bacterium]
MKVGFSVLLENTGVELRLFGVDCGGRFPLLSHIDTPDYLAALFGSLHYRDDLRRPIPDLLDRAPSGQKPATGDAELALGAYLSQGVRGIERLEGDYCLVIWDGMENRLLAARDPMGGYPLYWMRTGTGLRLCTSLTALAGSGPQPSLDLDYVADYLMASSPVNEMATERTPYKRIHRVRPGSIVTAHSRSPARVEEKIYWTWLDRLQRPGSIDPVEIGMEYGELLRGAVRERLAGKVASHLSGGMDSTAISLLAADLIARGRAERPLHTISLVYEKLPCLARETPFIEAALEKRRGEVDAHRIPADELLDFMSFPDPPPHDEPIPGLYRWGLDRATIDAALALRADTLLTGIGADELLDVQPFVIADMLRKGRFLRAWKESCAWALADNCSPWEILHAFGIRQAFPMLTGPARAFGSRPESGADLLRQEPNSIPGWIRPGFAARYDLRARAVSKEREIRRLCPETTLRQALGAIESRRGDANRWFLAASSGLTLAHPFLDVRLLRHGLGILAVTKAEPGSMKPVLAAATRNLLPDAIRLRSWKGHFNEVYYLGLSRHWPYLESLVRSSSLEDLGVIRKDELTRCLRQAALGAVGVRASQRLNLTLSLVRWFSLFERGLPSEVHASKIVTRGIGIQRGDEPWKTLTSSKMN